MIYQGEEIVDVQTPDGRTIPVPRSLVPQGMMPQQIGQTPTGFANVPLVQNTPVMPDEVPQDVMPQFDPNARVDASVTPPPAFQDWGVERAQPVQNTEDYTAGTVYNPTIDELNKQQAAQAQRQQQLQAYLQTPEGRIAQSQATQAKADADAVAAAQEKTDTERATLDAVSKATDARNTHLDQLDADEVTAQAKRVADEEKIVARNTTMRDKIANTRIDRTADHPILAALGIALAGFGAALQGKTDNPAMEAFYKAIDRKVAGQMADLGQMEKVYGLRQDELADLRHTNKSAHEAYAMMYSAELAKSARHVEAIVAQTASAQKAAEGKVLIATLNQGAAAKLTEAVHWGADYQQKKEQHAETVGLQRAGLNQAAQFHQDEMADRAAERGKDMAIALAKEQRENGAASAKMKMELAKENRELSVNNLVTNKPILTQDGVDKYEDAKTLEAQANALELKGGPAQHIAKLRENAAAMRGDAEITNSIKFSNVEEKRDFTKHYTAAQALVNAANDIKLLYKKYGPAYLGTGQGQQALQAARGVYAMRLKDAFSAGAYDKGLQSFLDKTGGPDPTQGWTWGGITGIVGNDPDPSSRLDEINKLLKTDVYLYAKVGGKYDVKNYEKLFAEPEGPSDSPALAAVRALEQEHTPGELEKDAGLSAPDPTSALTSLNSAVYGKDATREGGARARASARGPESKEYPGLSEKQGAAFGAMLSDPNVIVGRILDNATTRPDLALAYLRNLKSASPITYDAARVQLPTGPVRDQIAKEDTSEPQVNAPGTNNTQAAVARIEAQAAGAALTPFATLVEQAKNPADADAYNDLVRRATDTADPFHTQARGVLWDVIAARRNGVVGGR